MYVVVVDEEAFSALDRARLGQAKSEPRQGRQWQLVSGDRAR